MEQILDADSSISQKHANYAGFWIRVAAYFIDGIILSIISIPINVSVVGLGMYTGSSDPYKALDIYTQPTYWIAQSVIWIIYLGYFAGMECSKYQATLGKLAVGIKVVDLDGNKITFGRSIGRFFSKFFISVLTFIFTGFGFWMAGIDKKKQALHDKIAKTLVIYK